MAQQESIIKLKGHIGDLTFYKNDKGYQARKSTGINPARIAKDPSFQRSRENAAEFGHAVQAAKYLRNSLRPLLLHCPDSTLTNRLHSRMLRVVKADGEHLRGERNILPQHTRMLRNFDFNAAAPLYETVLVDYTIQADSAANLLRIIIPAFYPRVAIVAPKTATHFQWVVAGLPIDFGKIDEGYPLLAYETGDILSLHHKTEMQTFTLPLAGSVPVPSLFVLLGVLFFEQVMADVYPLPERWRNPFGVVGVLPL